MVYGELFTFNSSAVPVSDILNESIWIEPDSCNHAQLLLVTIVYGVVLYQSSNLIANGSEFLLLVPSVSGLVGSIVLPILGAVPDGMMTLCSGLGPDAQNTVGAGVGVLAGSTVMLLTFPWFIALTYGRVPIVDGKAKFGTESAQLGLLNSGISFDPSIKKSALIMLLTSLIYLIIQVPSWSLDNDTNTNQQQGAAESKWALYGLVVSTVAFVGYLVFCYRESNEDKVLMFVVEGIRNRTIGFGGALDFVMDKNTAEDKGTPILENNVTLTKILRPFFAKYDLDNSGKLDKQEFTSLLRDLDEHFVAERADTMWKLFDNSGDGQVEFNEFCTGFASFLRVPENYALLKSRTKTLGKIPRYGSEDEDEEMVPDDLAHLSFEEQQTAIKFRAAWMMALGTATVVLVSDPFVDVLTNWGGRLGLNPFYISFVVAPFASNASELLSAYTYATKKTKKAITTSLSTLIGAACMNNTLCLGIFFALIYFQNLAWQFTAETTAIILIQWIIGLLAMANDTQTWAVGYVILMCYPLCLFVVYYLQNVVGWD